jgi:hypothetical protein
MRVFEAREGQETLDERDAKEAARSGSSAGCVTAASSPLNNAIVAFINPRPSAKQALHGSQNADVDRHFDFFNRLLGGQVRLGRSRQFAGQRFQERD